MKNSAFDMAVLGGEIGVEVMDACLASPSAFAHRRRSGERVPASPERCTKALERDQVEMNR
jgi:hypothetical protein